MRRRIPGKAGGGEGGDGPGRAECRAHGRRRSRSPGSEAAGTSEGWPRGGHRSGNSWAREPRVRLWFPSLGRGELRAFSRGSSPAGFPWNLRSFPSGATRNQIQLMGAGATALYCERLQLGGFSSNASQARQGKNEVHLLRAITADSLWLQKGKATLLAFCLLDSL